MGLWDEILEQPAVLDRLRSTEGENVVRLARVMRRHDVKHVVIAARWTSDNAARFAQYVWERAIGCWRPWQRPRFSATSSPWRRASIQMPHGTCAR
jgi:hypothetical protein